MVSHLLQYMLIVSRHAFSRIGLPKSSWEICELHSVQPNSNHKILCSPEKNNYVSGRKVFANGFLTRWFSTRMVFWGRRNFHSNTLPYSLKWLRQEWTTLVNWTLVLCIQIQHWMWISDPQKGDTFMQSCQQPVELKIQLSSEAGRNAAAKAAFRNPSTTVLHLTVKPREANSFRMWLYLPTVWHFTGLCAMRVNE